jgi:hypothetical protein
MITKIYKRVKNKKGVKILQGRAREGWGKSLHLKKIGSSPAEWANVGRAKSGAERSPAPSLLWRGRREIFGKAPKESLRLPTG